MIKTIAHKEFLQMVRDGRFKWVAGIVFCLLLASLVVGWRHYQTLNTQHELAQTRVREQWLSQPEQNPHSGAHYGTYAFKPKTFLSSIDTGIEPYVGAAVWLEAHNQNQFQARPAEDATAVERFGQLTAAVVLQILLPLLIILVSFSAFAGEREEGTLRQLVSLGIKPSHLAAGKALGIAAALALILVPAVVIGVITLSLLTNLAEAKVDSGRMLMMGFLYVLYFSIFISVSLAVSAKARSSRLALVILLGFWIFNGLIAPRFASDLSRSLYPGPSNFEFESNIKLALQYGVDGNTTYREVERKRRTEIMSQYGVNDIKDLPVNFAGIRLQMNEDWGYEVFDKFYGDLHENFRKQNRVQQIGAAVAPLLAIRSLSMGLAGTDYYLHQDFAEKAEMHRRLEVKIINDDITFNGAEAGSKYVNGIDVWEKVPPFQYQMKPVSWVLGNHWVSLLILIMWFGLAGGPLCWTIRSIKAG
ncbi:MAG: ABC transporter permease subunit [Acidobacteriota bacterium]|nr:ABC transporter permease subunit [Acidobacteriota bacterium]